ncbi:hypothetical protein CLERM_560 [Coxiella-like endosymbiont]|nr:hypothetical protein CLERM_560 [Coxiella-like endosymbiont]
MIGMVLITFFRNILNYIFYIPLIIIANTVSQLYRVALLLTKE